MNLPWPWFISAVAARTVLVLLALTVGIRIFGNRGLGELNLIDLILVLLLGNAVQNAMTTGSGDLGAGLVCAGILLLADWALGSLLSRWPALGKATEGEPIVIVTDGRADRRVMRKMGVEEDELMAAVRAQGLPDLAAVRLAVLEANGQISVIPRR